MPSPTTEPEILDFFTRWGAARDDVRAVILYSSRANPTAHLDRFSDYDVMYIVTDVWRYFNDKRYLEDYGRVLTCYQNPMGQQEGFDHFGDITQYENGIKIDYTFLPVGWLEWAAAQPECPEDLDLGYRVLLDRDHLATRIQPPSGRAYIPKPPPRPSSWRWWKSSTPKRPTWLRTCAVTSWSSGNTTGPRDEVRAAAQAAGLALGD